MSPARPLRGISRFPLALLIGAIVNGLAAAAAVWSAQHELGLVNFAPLAQIWTIWSLVAAALVFGFQQWEITRSRDLPPGVIGIIPRQVLIGVGSLAVATGLGTYAAHSSLFATAEGAWPLAAACLPIGTATAGVSYGILAHAQRVTALGAIMAGENLLRLALTGLLIGAHAPAVLYAITVPAGFIVPAVPLVALHLRNAHRAQRIATNSSTHIAGVAAVGLLTNMAIFGAPLLLGLAGGAPVVVSALFLVLLPVRVPFLLVMALLPAFTVYANRLVASAKQPALHRMTRQAMTLCLVVAVAAAPIAATLGDPIAGRLFGIGGVLAPVVYALMASSAVLGLTVTATNVVVIAESKPGAIYGGWAIAIVAAAVLVATGVMAEAFSLGVWMVASNLVVFAAHRIVVRKTNKNGAEPEMVKRDAVGC